MDNQLINILNEVVAISRKYDEQAKASGEKFNIFRILKLTADEVRTHSAFIAELLNPKGSHGKGAEFLRAFINQLDLDPFDCDNGKVFPEQFIGHISDCGTEGGYIDILITDSKKNAIIIENKINAGDQKNQLKRYHNYGIKNHKNKFKLLYLSLYGSEATNFSKNDLYDEAYIPISYSVDLIQWLEKCKENTDDCPKLHETINQYITLVKHLTNQTITHKMKREIAEEITNNIDYIKSAFTIIRCMTEVRNNLIELFNDQLKEIANNLNLNVQDKLSGKRYSKIWFLKGHWQHKICMSFYSNDFNNFWIGIGKSPKNQTYKGNNKKANHLILKTLEKKYINSESDENYAWLMSFQEEWCPSDWSNDESVWLKIKQNDREFLAKIKALLADLSEIIDGVSHMK